MKADEVKRWQLESCEGLNLSVAHYVRFQFQRHFHLDYHIGVVQQGCQCFFHRGSSYNLAPGQVSIINPDESHDGHSLEKQGYQVRVLAISPSLMQTWVDDIADKPGTLPFFSEPSVPEPVLFQKVIQLHHLMESGGAALAIDGELLACIADLLRYQGKPSFGLASPALSGQQLSLIKEYLVANMDGKIHLQTLADLLGLSRFQFLRQFKQAMHITPHAYLKCLRLEHSMKLLEKGLTICDAAQAVGFYDQSHFNRAFKQAFGIAPSLLQHL
ncbi:AraC family transcriptional regulator [Endozoicomonas sp. SM1973]|uniref:AraC family transcriptional regulator n=1 Tax=Spartinivicinus marinus TaxID=2994442 RepID=A0A853IG39_9GAMM|nr:AraC family transcriptional regulator [Spartinivicinus marinus]MCX4026824.1 AraC family transcriptional regulator [Spartinivicinus marinus]NYZ69508.1 AraC family transcriptional regulator [Spartinivicinus marinus]